MALKEYIGLARLTEVLGYLKNYIDSHSGAVTAGTGLTKTNDVMSIKEFASGDMADIVTPLPSTPTRGIAYSTEEQVIGTWIDDKPLYQKTVECQFGTVTDGTWSTINIQDSIPSNASKAFIINAALLNSITVGGVPIPYYKDDMTRGIKAYINNGVVRVVTNWSQYSNSHVYVTIQYTKATD